MRGDDDAYRRKDFFFEGDKYRAIYFNSKIAGAPVVVSVICLERGIVMDPMKNINLIDAAINEVSR